MSEISIVSVNIEYGNRNLLNINERSQKIIQNEPDIIFIQECNNSSIDFQNKYEYIDYKILNEEVVDIYLKKNSKWKKDFIFQFNTKYSYTIRTCKIIFLKNIITNKILKLANVHLCGGRFDEDDKIGGMLIGDEKQIQQRKNEVLEKLINEYDIDIIAGDFNSDINCYLNDEILPHHLEFLKKVSPNTSIQILKEWNKSPYNFLDSNLFTLAINKENIRNTSIYKTHPDSIWFKNCNLIEFDYVDLLQENLSDHNGLYCKLLL